MSESKYFITTEELRKDLDELSFLRKENARLREALKALENLSGVIRYYEDTY